MTVIYHASTNGDGADDIGGLILRMILQYVALDEEPLPDGLADEAKLTAHKEEDVYMLKPVRWLLRTGPRLLWGPGRPSVGAGPAVRFHRERDDAFFLP